jgi:hypothetical protein
MESTEENIREFYVFSNNISKLATVLHLFIRMSVL